MRSNEFPAFWYFLNNLSTYTSSTTIGVALFLWRLFRICRKSLLAIFGFWLPGRAGSGGVSFNAFSKKREVVRAPGEDEGRGGSPAAALVRSWPAASLALTTCAECSEQWTWVRHKKQKTQAESRWECAILHCHPNGHWKKKPRLVELTSRQQLDWRDIRSRHVSSTRKETNWTQVIKFADTNLIP